MSMQDSRRVIKEDPNLELIGTINALVNISRSPRILTEAADNGDKYGCASDRQIVESVQRTIE
jgi:hypothetical protein